MTNDKHKESRDVTLDDVATISNDMTNCINKDVKQFRNAEIELIIDERSPLKEDSETNEKINGVLSSVPQCIDDTISENSHSSKGRTPYYNTRLNRNLYESPNSTDDVGRKELLWTKKIEDVIKGWHHNCLNFASTHGKRAKYHKKIFYWLSIPAAVIPMALASSSELITENWKIITIVSLITTGTINIVIGFKNPGKRAESHLNFESLYNQLAVEITSELVKPKCHRQAADVFIQRIMDRYNSLNDRAPPT